MDVLVSREGKDARSDWPTSSGHGRFKRVCVLSTGHELLYGTGI